MIVYTGGTFDLFHPGHVELLWYCRLLAGPSGAVVVGLNTDAFVARYKGRAPVDPYERREARLRLEPDVDVVIPNVGEEDSRRSIAAAVPDVVLIGSDWHTRDYLAQLGLDFDWLHAHRIVLAYAPRPSGGPSTTEGRANLGSALGHSPLPGGPA